MALKMGRHHEPKNGGDLTQMEKKERKEKIFFRRVLMHFKHIQLCFKVSVTWYWWRNGHIDKLNRIENYVSNAYGNLVCDKGDISIKYRGSYLCNKCIKGARWEVSGGESPDKRRLSLWYQLQGQGIPKTTLRFDNLVVGLKKLIWNLLYSQFWWTVRGWRWKSAKRRTV